jgi:hypothetical protein
MIAWPSAAEIDFWIALAVFALFARIVRNSRQ